MNQGVDLDNLTRAAHKREFEDGLMDFALAIAFLALGLIFSFVLSPDVIRWYQSALGNFRTLLLLGVALFLVVLFLVVRGGGRVIEHIRITTIWRDRGFVKPLRRQVSWPTTILAAGVTLVMMVGAAFLMAMGRIDIDTVLRTLVASSGLATGIMYFGMGATLSVRRFLVVGVIGGALSAAILLTSASFSVAWLLMCVIWLTVLSISGLWGLRQALSMTKESRRE